MVLACIKQDLQADEVGDPIDTELSAIITSLLTKGMAEDKLQEKMTKIARPQNCEALTKVKVNQLIWDNLSANVRSQDLRMQKVQTSLIKGITGVVIATNKILSRLDSIPEGRDLTQGLSDGIAMLANASSIGDGGIGPCCAKNPTQKKTGLTGNPKVKYFRNAKVKSQGQIFQECQGQIPRSNISGMPRSNPKVKFPKVKWETTKNWKKPVLTGKIGKMGNGKMGKCNKNEKTKNT